MATYNNTDERETERKRKGQGRGKHEETRSPRWIGRSCAQVVESADEPEPLAGGRDAHVLEHAVVQREEDVAQDVVLCMRMCAHDRTDARAMRARAWRAGWPARMRF